MSLVAVPVHSHFLPSRRIGPGRLRAAGRLARVCLLGLALLLPFVPLRAWDTLRFTQAAAQQGPLAVAGARDLQALLSRLATADDRTRIGAVNDFFNRRIAYAEDIDVWGQQDYWASPLEMLGRGRGDCEDYVIGKYFSLIALGMPTERLRLVYVRARLNGAVLAHMVLAYYAAPGADPLVLDNLIADVRPAASRPDLEPVFSFNSEGLWQGMGAQSAGDPVARLSRWREVLDKARGEGFLP